MITASVPSWIIQFKEKLGYIHNPKVGLTYHLMQSPYSTIS